ncbi:uncharacterized protein LOC141590528 [Silene latifolia]|uniref:uncharacterized protein LOC141590528 n=1 Tax=Silene latifolia TaxID=37657 RepID=UPI003D7795EC
MEVLSRLLRRLPRAANFSYHPKYVQLNLTHLVFANDLLVFTRGDLPSVKAVADCLDKFSHYSDLHVNPSKTELYFGGVADTVRDLILDTTGFNMGAFPFRYLGLPLFNARITQDMYQPLVNSVIFGLHTFWRETCLPEVAVAMLPKIRGGIGIKEVLSWNCAQMMKWVWKLFYRPHCIWAKWITTYVLKGTSLWDAQQTVSNSWYWNNVLKMKDLLLGLTGSLDQALHMLDACTAQMRYSTDTMYGYIRARRSPVTWAPLIHGT